MNLILLSGGSGKRLWPLSNDTRSKQFLKVLSDKDGNMESMVQRVWRQLKESNLSNQSLIATSSSQVDMIQSQIEENVTIITEPERRDTFPAIALASAYLYSVNKCNLNEVVAVLPVDPYVENHFFEKVKDLENQLNSADADLALIGVKPTYPSEKYGYIVPEKKNTNSNVYRVENFKEKPNENTAINLIRENAFWNCGVFGFKLKYIIDLLIEKQLPTDYKQLLDIYPILEKTSFDYEVVEKAESIIMLPYEGYWKDLGTWNTLTEEMSTAITGNGIMSNDIENTHIVNELDIPITVLGINNAIVAASPDGILVSDKDSSPKIKDYLHEGPIMYEEYSWGWYRILDYVNQDNSTKIITKKICVYNGQELNYQTDHLKNHVWSFITGNGEISRDDNKYNRVKSGDVFQLNSESYISLKAASTIELIEIQTITKKTASNLLR